MFETLVSIVILVFVLLFAVYILFTILPSAPFVPSSNKRVKQMIDAANLSQDDIVFDLGCGNGKLLFEANKKRVKQTVGFDINPMLIIFNRLKVISLRRSNMIFINKSLFDADLTTCTKLFVYLSPNIMKKLEQKILEEMPDGAVIISNTFSFRNLREVDTGNEKVKKYIVEKVRI